MRAQLAAWLVIATPAVAHASFSQTASSDPHAGIHTETWQDTTIPAVVHLVQINLSSADIDLVATPPQNAGITTGAFSNLVSAAVAINGDSFSINYVPEGLAMGGQPPQQWTNTSDDGTSSVFYFAGSATPTTGQFTQAALVPSGEVVTFATLPTGTLGVVSGKPQLVRYGQAIALYDCTDPVMIACQAAPRSALGLSADGNTLTLYVVDGWQTSSIGLTDEQLAQFVAAHGGYMAMALDSGSSSTLVVDGTLASSPSDGVQVPVANHLAVQFSPQTSGNLIGLACEHSLNDCSSTYIPGVTVTMDTGATTTTSASGVYEFTNVTPRYTCATAKKTGYYSNSRCVVVGPGPELTYDSIVLTPCPASGCVPVDAAMPDAPVVYPDAPAFADAGGRDAANAETGAHGGCCNTGDRPPLVLIAIVAWFLVRRRGTTVLG